MKAIILAAGVGKRMMPLTRTTHKTLLPVAGRPVLGWILDAVQSAGIREVVLVVGYRADEVREFVEREFPELRVTWVENHRYRETNNICSLALALDHTRGDDVLVIESDLVISPQVVTRLLENPRPNVALLAPHGPGMDGTVVRADPQSGLVTDVFPPHLQPGTFDYSDKLKTLNIYKFSRQFSDDTLRRLMQFYARAFDENCYYEVILGVLIYLQRAEIYAEVIDPRHEEATWAEVDDPVDLDVANFSMDRQGRQALLDGAHGGFWKYPILDFHYLRNMHFPTPGMLAELRCHLPDLLSNYGSSQEALDRKFSQLMGCEAREMVALNGCAQAFPWLARRLHGRRTLVPQPTFGEYARIADATPYADDGRLAFSTLAEQVRRTRPDAVVIVNPNNPTGTTFASDEILRLAHECRRTEFIVDESFIEFSSQPSLLELAGDLRPANLLVLKSLSKVWGVPGLRLGWAYSPAAEIVDDLRRSLPIWNMNSVAEYFVELMFKHRNSLAESFVRSRCDREEFTRQLAGIEDVAEVLAGGGNFVVLRFASRVSAADLARRLLAEHRIYVKEVTGRWADGQPRLRVAVRNGADNAQFCAALSGALCAEQGRPQLKLFTGEFAHAHSVERDLGTERFRRSA